MKRLVLLPIILACATTPGARADDPRVVRTIVNRKLPHLDMRFRHLALDDLAFARRTDGVEKVYHQAEKIGRPLLRCEAPHEQEAMSLNVPSVLYDAAAQKYRMWWHNVWFRRDERGRRRLFVPPCYAESDNGLTWTKPDLEQIEYEGDGGANNCIAGIRDPLFSVCLDHDGRLRGFWCPRNGTCLLDDGVLVRNAQRLKLPPLPGFAEVRAVHGSAVSDQWRVTFDPVTQRYVATAKTWATLAGSQVPAKFRRAVTVLTSDDASRWTATGRIIQTDLAYDRYAERLPSRQRPEIPAWSELHDMNLQRYEQLLIGLNCILFTYDEDGAGGREITGSNTEHFLTWSRDGLGWSRPATRRPLIAAPWGSGDWGRHTTGSPFMVVQPTELWLYCDIGHGHTNDSYRPPRGKTITMARLRRDGFASLRADETGWIETAPFVAGGRLRLNVDAKGGVRVAALAVEEDDQHVGPRKTTPIEGFAIENCRPIQGDRHAAAVSWDAARWSQLDGRLVALRIELREAALYSFWTRENAGAGVVTNLVTP